MKKTLLSILAVLVAFVTYAQQPRAEYPRPQFERQDWINLNGEWSYTFDFVGSGLERKLYNSKGFNDKIIVPFCPESKLSGVQYTDFINHIWYQRTISMPKEWEGRNVKLNFGAIYYNSEVYIDGRLVGRHFGGSTSFAFDVTKFIADGNEHSLVVHAYSDTRTAKQPAGKQNMRYAPFECMYTRTTGIWQTVWMEPVAKNAIERTQVTTDIDQNMIIVQ
ncbi:MAG: beta-glucuronidase, partial [Bacteroidaceae bacterium]|nr:beta-glucuronidase [Bacteroidaceae bacterium]MBQ5817118.1 beta-glucuronidase [Bacteroidaceae bacterium]